MKKFATILTAMLCLIFVFGLNVKAAQSGDYKYAEKNGSIIITDYTGSATVVKIPSTISGKKVTGIGQEAFYECDRLTSVTIPYGVKTIGDSAFVGCTHLKNITIPNSVKTIGERVFFDCTSLKKIILPNSVKAIGNSAFYNCKSLKSIAIPKKIKRIEAWTFRNCSSLKNVTIPKGVTSIGSEAFYQCTSLKSINIPSGMKDIGWSTFCACTSLQNVTIPDSITKLRDDVFFACNSLKSITIPKNVTLLDACGLGYGGNAKETITIIKFSGTWKISGFTIKGYTNTSAETYAKNKGFIFESLDSPAEKQPDTAAQTPDTTLPAGSIQTVNDNKYRVTSDSTVAYAAPVSKDVQAVSIPSTVTVNDKVYTVTAIMPRAFAGCKKMKAVLIPATIKTIGTKAFFKCKKLKKIYIRTSLLTRVSIGKAAFKKVHKKARFYVPATKKKAYKKILRKRGMTGKMKVK